MSGEIVAIEQVFAGQVWFHTATQPPSEHHVSGEVTGKDESIEIVIKLPCDIASGDGAAPAAAVVHEGL